MKKTTNYFTISRGRMRYTIKTEDYTCWDGCCLGWREYLCKDWEVVEDISNYGNDQWIDLLNRLQNNEKATRTRANTI